MLFALVLVPLVFAGVAFAVPSQRWRPWILPLGGSARLVLYLAALRESNLSALDGWLVLDPLGRLVLGLISVLFLLSSLYAPAWLALKPGRSNRVFCANLLVFLAMMTLITVAHHLGLMWVAIEATTLALAPLIYFNHSGRSLEATWKYLLIGSVGIALSLLGSFFLAYSALGSGLESSLLFEDLIRDAPQLSRPWLHAAFVLLFVGYGTKMGLAPMHTWKPDAYGEAPGLVGALLAGGLTNCAFLAILRFFHILSAAGEAAFARELMIGGGLFLLGFFAITGAPPFGPFVSEFTILSAAVSAGRYVLVGLFLLLLVIVFIGMGATVLAVVQGTPVGIDRSVPAKPETFLTVAPAVAFLILVLCLGLYLPPPLQALIQRAAAFEALP